MPSELRASLRYVSARSSFPPRTTSPVLASRLDTSTTLKYLWFVSSAAAGTLIFPRSRGASPSPANAATITGTCMSNTGNRDLRSNATCPSSASFVGNRVQYGPYLTTQKTSPALATSSGRSWILKMSTSSSPILGSSAACTFCRCRCSRYSSSMYAETRISPYGSPSEFLLFPEVSKSVSHFAGGGLSKPSWMSRSSHLICTCPMSSSNPPSKSYTLNQSVFWVYGRLITNENLRSHSGASTSSM